MKYLLMVYMFMFSLNAASLNDTFKELKEKKEKEYQFINGSGIEQIHYGTNFLKIVFKDKQVFCENDSIIVDNCSVMLNKKEVLDNVNSTAFLKEFLGLFYRNKFLVEQEFGMQNLFYLVNPMDEKSMNELKPKLKPLTEKLSIIYVPKDGTIEELEKVLNTKLIQSEIDQLRELYKKHYEFTLPTSVILQ